MDIPSGEWFFSLADVVILSHSKEQSHYNCREILSKQKFLYIDEEWPEDINSKIIAIYTDFLYPAIDRFKVFKNAKIVLTHGSDYVPDEIKTVKWLNQNPNVRLYAVNLTFEHPRAFILPIGQANLMWPHGDKKIWSEIKITDKNTEVLKTYYLNTHISRCNLNMLNHPKIETIGNLNYKDFVNKLLSSKFVICPPGNGPDTHRMWETLSAQAIPILLNTPFNNLLKKQYPDLPLVIVDDYFTFDYNSLEYNFPNYINILDKSYWINKIKNEA
jgi:hypothetical protein